MDTYMEKRGNTPIIREFIENFAGEHFVHWYSEDFIKKEADEQNHSFCERLIKWLSPYSHLDVYQCYEANDPHMEELVCTVEEYIQILKDRLNDPHPVLH